MNPLLAKLLQSVADPQLPGPLNNLPAPVKRLLPVLAGPIGQVASPGYQVGAPLVKRALGLEGDIAKGIAGYAALPFTAVAADTGDPNDPLTQYTRRMVGNANDPDPSVRRALLLQYLRHPGRQADLLRESPDPVTSWLAGALELASHPLNYTGGVGEFGRGLEEGAPLVGGAIKHAATAGEVVNRAQALPMIAPFLVPGAAVRLWRGQELASPALRALTTAPEWERAVQAGAGGAERAASEALHAALESPTMRRLQDAPGLPPAATAEALANAKVGPSKALGLPLTPEPVDLRLAQRELGLPQVTALPRLPASPLEAARTPNLLAIAKRAERAARPALAPTEAAPDIAQVLPELAQSPALPGRGIADLGGITDRAALGGLSNKEIDTLVDLAYPHENALNNAMAKYTDDATLAGAAWDRVTKNPDLLQRLMSIDEPLARKLALLPEREGAALPDATPEQLAELAGGTTPDVTNGVADVTNGVTSTSGAREAFDQLIATRDEGKMGSYLPGPDFFAKRLGIPIEEAQGYIDDLVKQGVVGDAMGTLAFKPSAQGGDIAAGGGGGLMFTVPGGNLAVRGVQDILGSPGAAATGIAGGVLGAGVGAATSPDGRPGGALKGAGAGLALGYGGGRLAPEVAPALGQLGSDLVAAAPPLLRDTMVDPGMWTDGIRHGWESFQAVREAGRGAKSLPGAANKQWRAQVVNTLKQLPQDALNRAFVMWGVASKEFGAAGADLRRWQGILRGERAAGQSSLTNPLTRKLRALGRRDVLAELGETYGVDFGSAVASDSAKDYLGPGGRAATGALIGMGSALKTVNPIAPLYGAARGYAAPFVDGMIRFMNAIQHDAFRYALGEKALDRDIPRLAEDFLSELARQGHDVRPLEGREGFFSPQEVARVAGGQAGKDWDMLTLALIKRQGDRIAFLGGDFRKSSATKFEQGLGKVVPFSQWSIRYAPVLAEVAARHPRAATLAVAELGREQRDAADKGLQPYQAGAATVTTETPLLGAAVRARLGGAKGKMTLDPLGALVPYGDVLSSPPATDQEQTGYQKVTGLLGRVGFQPHPLAKDIAYVAGQDYSPSSDLSRTAPLERLNDISPVVVRAALARMGRPDLAAQVPSMPQLPSGRQLLDAGRQLLSPVTGAGVPTSDPVARRYAELVLEETGKPLDDPENARYLASVGDESEPLWAKALVQSRLAGAATNATGQVSPIQTTGQTATAAAAQASGGLPYSDYEIRNARTPGEARAMQLENARARSANPATATYHGASGSDRKAMLLAAWDERHQGLKRLSPRDWAAQRAAYADTIR